MSVDPTAPAVPATPLAPLTKAPFFSPRNVPLWVGLTMMAVVAGIVAFSH